GQAGSAAAVEPPGQGEEGAGQQRRQGRQGHGRLRDRRLREQESSGSGSRPSPTHRSESCALPVEKGSLGGLRVARKSVIESRKVQPYYEQKFSDRSHGFRPNRGCHSALREVRGNWTGTVWFIEGDIK